MLHSWSFKMIILGDNEEYLIDLLLLSWAISISLMMMKKLFMEQIYQHNFLVNAFNSVMNMNHVDWTLYNKNLRPKFS